MALAKTDPRNVDVVVKRKEELLGLAAKAGINCNAALENSGGDTIVQIGVLAKLLGIDAMVALNPAASVVEALALSQDVLGSSRGEHVSSV